MQDESLRYTYLVTQLVFAVLYGITSAINFALFLKHKCYPNKKKVNGIQMLFLSQTTFCFFQTLRLGLADVVMTVLNSLDPFINITTRNCLNILATAFVLVTISIIVFIW